MKNKYVVFLRKSIALVLLTLFLTGCDRQNLKDVFIGLGIMGPSIDDIEYGDTYLDDIFSDIKQLSPDGALIEREYAWLLFRHSNCKSQKLDLFQQCYSKMNAEHHDKLDRTMIELLLRKPLPESIPDEINIPKALTFSPRLEGSNGRNSISYSDQSGMVAYLGRDKIIYLGNLFKNNSLATIPSRFPSKNSVLEISKNGELLLEKAAGKAAIIRVTDGRLLHQIEGFKQSNIFFAENNKYLLLQKDNQIFFYDLIKGESTGISISIPYNERSISFNHKANAFLTWGSHGKRSKRTYSFSIIPVSESGELGFGTVQHHKIPDVLQDSYFIYPLLNSSDNNVIIMSKSTIFKYDLESKMTMPLADMPNSNRLSYAMVVDGYFFYEKRNRDRRQYEYHMMDLKTGKQAALENSQRNGNIFAPFPAKNTLLSGNSHRVELFRYDPSQLEFKEYEPPQKKQKQGASSRSETVTPAAPPKPVAVPGQSVYKCKNRVSSFTFSDKPCPQNVSAEVVKVGQPMPDNTDTAASMNFVKKGPQGLMEAIRKGYLRHATDRDLARWKRKSSVNKKVLARLSHYGKYVLLKPVYLRGGLTGAHSVIFIVNDRKLTPIGDLGHSLVLYSNTGACQGSLCN